MKKALCVGVNDYPYDGIHLNGCLNDARAWAELFVNHYDFSKDDVKLLLDRQATTRNILEQLKSLIAGAQQGDTLVFTISSHGSYLIDSTADGQEQYHEILCPYDIEDNQIMFNDLREPAGEIKSRVDLTLIIDSCFSGTATRAAFIDIVPGIRTPDDRRVRFLSPALRGLPILRNPWSAKPAKSFINSESEANEILLTASAVNEYSYDAYFEGAYHGAMTHYALQAIRKADYRLTYSQLHRQINSLIGDYPQHPQLKCGKASLKRQIFRPARR
jgi:metacaspase-1